jgi:hypothetical protein
MHARGRLESAMAILGWFHSCTVLRQCTSSQHARTSHP